MVAHNKMVFLGLKNKFGMKQFKILCMKSFILLLAIVSISCSNSKPIKKMREKNIVLYKISEIPTLPEEQLAGKKYVLDYEVLTYWVNWSRGAILKKTLKKYGLQTSLKIGRAHV